MSVMLLHHGCKLNDFKVERKDEERKLKFYFFSEIQCTKENGLFFFAQNKLQWIFVL